MRPVLILSRYILLPFPLLIEEGSVRFGREPEIAEIES